ncbi:MAG: ABC transporter permease [Gemmatimonadota bacterium]
MRFEILVAFRYLRSGRLQTALILLGIVVGMLIFTLIASLINGLQDRIIDDVLGNSPHITLEPVERRARLLSVPRHATPLVGRTGAADRRARLIGWRRTVEAVRDEPGVAVVSPQAVGGGFLRQDGETVPVTITGVLPDRVSAIVDVAGGLREGSLDLAPGEVVLGRDLADEVGLSVGGRVRVRSERERTRSFRIGAIFDTGVQGLNEQLLFVDLAAAQRLLELEGAITRIELKVDDIWNAERVARRLAATLRLESTSWLEQNEQLGDALRAQSQSGYLIRFLSLTTIIIGVAGVLLVAAIRRSPEIGIMRGMGVSRRSVYAIFVLQGLLTGAFGSVLGAAFGFVFANAVRQATLRPDGTPAIPVDPAQGEYLLAILLATVASSLAAILPARSAAGVDPVEVLQT